MLIAIKELGLKVHPNPSYWTKKKKKGIYVMHMETKV
jgi:hypothetical protein